MIRDFIAALAIIMAVAIITLALFDRNEEIPMVTGAVILHNQGDA